VTDKVLKNQRPFIIISEKVRPEAASASGFSANATAAQCQTQSLLLMTFPEKSNQDNDADICALVIKNAVKKSTSKRDF
jgi:hypothetical protein